MPRITPETAERIRVDLPEAGEWIDIRRPTQGDMKRLQALSARLQLHMQGNSVSGSAESAGDILEAVYWEQMGMACVAWSWPDPITVDGLKQLDLESAQVLEDAINEHWRVRGADERKNSLTASPAPSRTPGASRRSSGG